MRRIFPTEWRTQTRWKRRFYARYMKSLERAGYVLVALVFAAFIAAFNYKVDDLVTADKVPVVPFARPLVAEGPTLLVRALAKDMDEVVAGQPLVEIVQGDDAIRAFGEWDAVQRLPREATLAKRYPRPATTILAAPGAGTFRLDAKEGQKVDDKAMLARVVDYDDLRLEASLTGDTVAKADARGAARIVNIAVEPLAGTLFRGGGAVSGQLLGEGVKRALEKGLVGRAVLLRDDVPLEVKEVTEVQVDASVLPLRMAGSRGAIESDPPADLRVAAQIVEGAPSATVQIADLPPEIAEAARQAATAALRSRTVRRADGTVATLGEAKDLRMVVKLKAGPEGGIAPIPGTMLTRSFDAKLKLVSPPRLLIDAVRAADAAGKSVTARVELRTGERPIALRLLKKS